MTPKINWNPTPKDMRQFGWTLLIGFGVIGALVFWKVSAGAALWVWGTATTIAILALTVPNLARPFYLVWMGLAWVMGSVMSRVILTIIFYLVITPAALVFKMLRRDALRVKKTQQTSYWNNHDEISDPKSYEHLF